MVPAWDPGTSPTGAVTVPGLPLLPQGPPDTLSATLATCANTMPISPLMLSKSAAVACVWAASLKAAMAVSASERLDSIRLRVVLSSYTCEDGHEVGRWDWGLEATPSRLVEGGGLVWGLVVYGCGDRHGWWGRRPEMRPPAAPSGP